MIIDITMKNNEFSILVLKKLFTCESMQVVGPESMLIQKAYADLGTFILPGDALGFEGCMKKVREDEFYTTFSFPFPEQVEHMRDFSKKNVLKFSESGSMEMNRFIGSLYLLFEYCMSMAEYEKNFSEEELADQSFFVNFGFQAGKAFVAGHTYPWFWNQMEQLSDAQLVELNNYVLNEMNRFSMWSFGKKCFCEQSNIQRTAWSVQGGMGGLWISSDRYNKRKPHNEFHSHNCDRTVDQRNLFAAVIALNTWLRDNAM